MKKILLFLMVFSLTIPFLSGCKKEEDPNIWQDGEYVDVVEPNDIIVENEDRNLAGKLYTEENKPEGSEEITVYRLKDDSLQPEEHKSFALPENIKIQYLLDTLETFAAFKTVELKGTVIGDTAIVNINDRYQLLAWMTNQYLNDTYKYNTPPEGDEGTDVDFYADGFAMAALEVIDRTIKTNLEVTTVVFKTNNDEAFLTLSPLCPIQDGIFFTESSTPRYIGSLYNYMDGQSIENVIAAYVEMNPNLANKTTAEKLEFINDILS